MAWGQWIGEYGLGWLLVYATCLWLYFFTYNVGICSMRRSFLKASAKTANKVFFPFVLPAAAILWYYIAPVEEVLALRPVSSGAWAVLGGIAAVWAFAIPCQIAVSLRIVRKPQPQGVVEWRRDLRPLVPSPDDWAAYDKPGYGRQPRAGSGSPPLPRYRRKVGRMHPRHYRNHLMHKPWMQWLNGGYRLQIHRIAIQFAELPEAFDGLRVLHLTDFHFSEMMSPRYFDHVIQEARNLKPDLIAMTGDYAGGNHLYRESIAIYEALDAPLGIYAVRGNHDYSSEPAVMAYWMRRAGIVILKNRAVTLERQGQRIELLGVEHPYKRVRDWGRLVDETVSFRLALSHTPDNIGHLARLNCQLVLSGHTHGGQGRLPVIGPLLVPSIHGRRFHTGFHRVRSSLLYVSAGVGLHTIPLRFRCRPEIALIELRRKATLT